MENQTGYNLTAAMENWRQELAAQGNLTAEVRRELETHLGDAMAGFRQRGLNEEESFWLACKRVGQPEQLGEEFVKADPAKVWGERIFWVAAVLLTICLWLDISSIAWTIFRTAAGPYVLNNWHFVSPFPDWVRFYLPLPSNIDLWDLLCGSTSVWLCSLLSMLPVIGIGLLLARGRLSQKLSWIQFLFRSRRRFLIISATLFLFYFLMLANYWLRYEDHSGGPSSYWFMVSGFMNLLYLATLMAVIAWLLPVQNRKAPKLV